MSSRHDYVNPAFCQKSEFYRSKKALSPPREIPKPAQTHQRIKTDISNNPLHNLKTNRYACVPSEDLPPKPGPKPGRYAAAPGDVRQSTRHVSRRNENMSKSRYELTELEENEDSVDVENTADIVHNGRVHRYAVIPTVDEAELRYESLPPMNVAARCHESKRYGSVPSSPVKQNILEISPARRQMATAMLHELLTIPPRSAAVSKSASFSVSPSGYRGEFGGSPARHTSTPKQLFGSQTRAPRRSSLSPPRAQRSLDYNRSPPRMSVTTNNAISDYEMSLLHRLQKQQQLDQRTLAVIPPRQLASPSSDVTVSDVTSAKMAAPGLTSVAIVAAMLIIAGALDSGLCMYMMYNAGRSYYLELGLVNGFACVALGVLGFRSSRCVWLPNRNYISGFILLTVLTLFACCGLLVLLVMRPVPGSAPADVTSGAISCLSALALLLVSLGVISTNWCKATPPDNRVDTTDDGY